MESDADTKLEDRRVEYTALREEILQADNTCLLMTGYLITSVGALYAAKLEWLVSFLTLVSLYYFTEKRFSIRQIASFMNKEICQDDSGFAWEKYIQDVRQKGRIRPFLLLRPYNAELFTCLLISISPLFNGITSELVQFTPKAIFWFVFFLMTSILSLVSFLKYNRAY
jgi:hypothetical protein